MSEAFDPYMKWLGIAPKDQPADHYRLLGVERFETDQEAIANAADQRMAHVKNFSGGRYGALAQQILNELSAARVCLLNPEKKAKYDESLREWLGKTAVPREPKLVLAVPLAEPVQPEQEPGSFLEQFGQEQPAVRPIVPVVALGPKKRPFWPVPLALGLCGLAVAIVAGVMVATRPDDSDQARQADPVTTTSPPPGPEKPPPGPTETKGSAPGTGASSRKPDERRLPDDRPEVHLPRTVDKPNTSQIPESRFPPRTIERPTLPIPPRPPESRFPPRPFERPPEPDRMTKVETYSNPPRVIDNGPRGKQSGVRDPQPKESGQPPASAKKLPEPNEEARKTADRDVRKIYEARFAKAQSSEQKLSLAADLEREAQQNQESPAVRFVLFCLASELAADANDLGQAMGYLDGLGRVFETNVLPRKADALTNHAAKLAKGPGPRASSAKLQAVQQENEFLMESARGLAKTAMETGDFEAAGRCLKIAMSAAVRLRDTRAKVAIQAASKEITRLQERERQIQDAEAVLETKPDDPAANHTVGSWYCLVKGDWTKGLPLLAKGDDADLAALAKQDLAAPQGAAPQAELGHRWWEYGEKQPVVEGSHARARAGHWYRSALPGLSGLQRVAIQERLDGLNVAGKRYALSFDGRSSFVVLSTMGTDGKQRPMGYDGLTPLTIEAICKPTTSESGYYSGTGTLFGNHDYHGIWLGARYSSWVFTCAYRYSATSTSPSSQSVNSNSSTMRTTRDAARRDAWLHVAGVYDGKQIGLFLDGKLQGTENMSGVYFPSIMPMMIGASRTGSSNDAVSNYFNGLIRAVRVSKLPLYSKDFQPPTELTPSASTVFLFRFNEGQGDQVRYTAGKVKIIGEIQNAEWVEVKEPERGEK